MPLSTTPPVAKVAPMRKTVKASTPIPNPTPILPARVFGGDLSPIQIYSPPNPRPNSPAIPLPDEMNDPHNSPPIPANNDNNSLINISSDDSSISYPVSPSSPYSPSNTFSSPQSTYSWVIRVLTKEEWDREMRNFGSPVSKNPPGPSTFVTPPRKFCKVMPRKGSMGPSPPRQPDSPQTRARNRANGWLSCYRLVVR